MRYNQLLESRPLLTKALTSLFFFGPMAHLQSPPSPADADTLPLPCAATLAARGATALGLGLLFLTAAVPAPPSTVSLYAARPLVETVTAGRIASAPLPRPALPPHGATAGGARVPAFASALSSSNLRPQMAGVPRGVAWASLLTGLAASAAVAVWNRLSTLNAERRAEELAEGAEELDAVRGAWAGSALAGAALAMALSPTPASAEIRLPPLDTDPLRCERAFVGNTIGQANGVSDRPLDLRQCDLADKDLGAMTLSGALMSKGKFSGASFVEAVLSKAYAVGADFSGANFSSAVLDRVTFDKADMSGANFYNAVITGATFEGTNLANAAFEDALIGKEDAKRLCKNPTLGEESRAQVGCR